VRHDPLRKDEFCTKRRARCVVAAVVIAALALYTPTTWTLPASPVICGDVT